MANSRYILDTSAVFALIEDEKGADRVEQVLTAARLKAGNRLSLADSIIAAFAIQNGAILLHKDPEYDALVGQVALEALPYK